jgi:hypothetical protein
LSKAGAKLRHWILVIAPCDVETAVLRTLRKGNLVQSWFKGGEASLRGGLRAWKNHLLDSVGTCGPKGPELLVVCFLFNGC